MATMNYDKIELSSEERNWLLGNPGIYPDDGVEVRIWESGSKKRVYVTIKNKSSWIDATNPDDLTLELRHDVNPKLIDWLARAMAGDVQSLAQKQNKGAEELQKWSKAIGSRIAKLAMVLDKSIDIPAASKAAQELIHPSTLDYIDAGYAEKVRAVLWNEDKWAIEFIRHHNDRQAKGGGIAPFNASEQAKLKEFAKRLEVLIATHEAWNG